MTYKKGDWVVCLPGFKEEHVNYKDNTSGGNGYKEDTLFQINEINHLKNSAVSIAWPKYGSGIFTQALRLATPLEIQFRKVFKIPIYEQY